MGCSMRMSPDKGRAARAKMKSKAPALRGFLFCSKPGVGLTFNGRAELAIGPHAAREG
jgi:hypothetical protein